MTLPFLPIVAATDASTVFGHGGVVADATVSKVSDIARLACKSGGHVRLGDGPTLSDELAARLGPRHIVPLNLGDVRVIFSVQICDPGHINLEEAAALIRYVRWVLRSQARFYKRLVVLVDSKVVIGAVTKGRSSSVPLNALVRRLGALCFAGGLVLHCIFIPTSHNPSDWPSRGGIETWPPALRWPRPRPRQSRCPACGVLPCSHPLNVPKAMRGRGHFCRSGRLSFAWIDDDWLPQGTFDLGRVLTSKKRRTLLLRCFRAWILRCVPTNLF